MEMKLNMLQLNVCNKIVSNLNCTFIVIVKNKLGFDRKPEIAQKLLDPNNLSASIDNTMILYFSSWQRDDFLFLRVLDQRSRTKRNTKPKVDFQSSLSLA